MKKLLPIAFLAVAGTAAAAVSDISTKIFPGEALSSISSNGVWVVGAAETEFSVIIRNLESDMKWGYNYNENNPQSVQYALGHDRAVSDNGIVIGLRNDMPAYWENGGWKSLPSGKAVMGVTGSITPDGSMIVGSLSETGMTYEEVQMSYPCIWYRNADGSYADPVFLPCPEKDMTGTTPQYLTAISVSDDGKTIGACMTCLYGFPHVPYVYTLGSDGNWTYKALGTDLINPEKIEFPEYPGEYNGPLAPNWEDYMTEEEIARFEAAFPAWAAGLEEQGYTPEDIQILEIRYVATFMKDEEKKEEYQKLVDEYYDAFFAWLEKYNAYEAALNKVLTEGRDFEMNNIRLSPDGKYLYSTSSYLEMVKPGDPENAFETHYAPVRFDVATGEAFLFSEEENILISSVTADYSVLGQPYSRDRYMPRSAFIFPQGDEFPMNIMDYFNTVGSYGAATWIDHNMFHEIVIDVTEGGNFIFEDAYSMGVPVPTPDMSLILFQTSSYYWYPEVPYMYYSYVLNPEQENVGVETVENAESAVRVLNGGNLLVSGDVASITVYDLAGAALFRATAPAGTVATGLPAGIYVVSVVDAAGNASSIKAVF